MILLRELGGFLELLEFSLVLLEHRDELLLLLDLVLGLLLVRLSLLLDFFGLGVDLRREGRLDARLLLTLLGQLLSHELHLFLALFTQVLLLGFQIDRLLLDQLVFLSRLCQVLCHL